MNFGIRLHVAGGHISHGNRTADAGAEAAAGDLANLIALAIGDRGAFAGRCTAFGLHADAFAGNPVLDLGLNDGRAREAAFFAAALADGPDQAGFDRGGGGVDVMAIEAQTEQPVAARRQAAVPGPAKYLPYVWIWTVWTGW